MNDSDRKRAIVLYPALLEIERELSIYLDLLFRWQEKINLVGPATLTTPWVRHFADSMQLLDLASCSSHWVDLGSGAGFPGMVIALAQKARCGGVMHLIESDVRKAAFLRAVSRETGANAIVHNARAEIVLPTLNVDVITSRAMASLAELVDLCHAHVEKGAIALFPKGRDVAAELTKISTSSSLHVKLTPSKTEPDCSIVEISAL